MMDKFKLDGPAEHALNRIQDTELSPMEEVLFKSWTKANGIRKPDNSDDPMDYRGLWKETGGKVLPWSQLERMTTLRNAESKLTQTLADRIMDRVAQSKQEGQARKDQVHKEQRQDHTHKQKMETGRLELQKQPHELKTKEIDLHKTRMGLDAQKLGNEGKQLDITKSVVEGQNAAAEPKTPTL
jgi:hypothetical protein